ncbi:MAG: HAD family hydrolase [Actinobacteria bacterium]|jgi:HAD superfamily hydrolase (TIGR01549 family)|nr:HAD family hydrolase [Actinomycetota bacterium]
MTTSEIPIDPSAAPPPDAVDDHLRELDFDPAAAPDPEGPAPRTVIFDVGEVLVDETRVWSIWADLLGVSSLTFASVLGAAISQGEDHHVVFPHLAPNVEWQEFVDEHERRFGGLQDVDVYADARPCLQELRDLGFEVGIAGNQPAIRTAQLRRLDLPHDVLITSEELGSEKPDLAFFAAVLELVGAAEPADVLYVGDRIDNDIEPAARFGMRTCWLRRGPWGHLQEPPDDLDIDLVLEGLGELPLLLAEWRG